MKMMINNTNEQAGMTLIEMVVTVGILAVLSVMVVVAFSAQRNSQSLVAAEQMVQSVIRQAQQMALDQRREEDCTNVYSDDALCSKVGLAFRGSEIIFFADINDSGRYEQSIDYELTGMRTSLSDTVTVTESVDVVYKADPPTVFLFFNGVNLTDHSHLSERLITLQTSTGQTRDLVVSSYGQVEFYN